MVVVRTTLALLLAAGAAVGSPLKDRSEYKLKDSHHVPKSWKAIAAAPGRHTIRLEIALKQGQFDELDRHLMEGTSMFPLDERRVRHRSNSITPQ